MGVGVGVSICEYACGCALHVISKDDQMFEK